MSSELSKPAGTRLAEDDPRGRSQYDPAGDTGSATQHGMDKGRSPPAPVNLVPDGLRPPQDLVASFAQDVIRHIAEVDAGTGLTVHGPSRAELEALCNALVEGPDVVRARGLIAAAAPDATAETISLDYLAAAARMLGVWWVEDRASFVAVTVGIGRIFELLREMRVHEAQDRAGRRLSMIFAAVPGEQHTLGVRMAADMFRADGWQVTLKIGLDQKTLVADIARADRCIVGLSVGGTHSLPALARLVAALHQTCPRARVIACGQDIDALRPRLAAMGVTNVASGLDEAKEKIAALWDREVRLG